MKNSARLISLALAAVLAVTAAGCQLVTVNPEKDVAASVNGTEIYMQEVNEMLDMYLGIYSMFGMDTSDPAQVASIKKDVLESLIQQQVIMQKASELGLDKFTAEEQAEIDAAYDDQLSTYKENFRATAEGEAAADSSVDVEARMTALFEEDMAKQDVTYDDIKKGITDQKIFEKIEAYVKDPVTATEDDAKAAYDEELASQKEAMEADPSSYDTTASSGTTPLVVPEGYMYVKNLLIQNAPSQEDADKITEMEAQQKTLSEEMSELILDDADKNAARIDEIKNEINSLKDQVAAINKAADEPAKAKADELYGKLTAGGDFDALLEEFGEDEGMKSEPGKTEGYLVGPGTTRYVDEFKNAALTLKNDGDLSAPIKSDFGYHILKRVSTVKPGEVAFEDVKDEYLENATTTKQNEAWDAAVKEWTEAAKIVKHENKLES